MDEHQQYTLAERVLGLITELRWARTTVAERVAALATDELETRLVKQTIVGEMTSHGVAATPADKAAGFDERYLSRVRGRVALEVAKDVALAEAEGLRFRVQLALLEVEARVQDPAHPITDQPATELTAERVTALPEPTDEERFPVAATPATLEPPAKAPEAELPF